MEKILHDLKKKRKEKYSLEIFTQNKNEKKSGKKKKRQGRKISDEKTGKKLSRQN